MSMKRKAKINIHCHIFNYDFIPDDISKLLSKFPESLSKSKSFQSVFSLLAKAIPGAKFSRLKTFLSIYDSPIEVVSSTYATDILNSNLDIYTPLLMNLEKASANKGKAHIPYQKQIDLISAEVLKYPWRIFPFVMFDPRSQTAFEDCKTALETKGYVGVKMYPAIGYHPDPDIVENIGIYGFEDKEHAPNEHAATQLRALYKYCNQHFIPITTHVTPGGSYSTDMHKDREKYAWPLTEISNWNKILSDHKDLKVNFAHFGGNFLTKNKDERILTKTWQRQILNLMFMYNSKAKARIFTDLSYHDMALGSDKDTYFVFLKSLLDEEFYKYYFLFGTDASMISHSYSEKEYVDGFKTQLTTEENDLIFSDNPLRFLFEDKKIPDTYITFLKNSASLAFDELPDYVVKKDEGYYLY